MTVLTGFSLLLFSSLGLLIAIRDDQRQGTTRWIPTNYNRFIMLYTFVIKKRFAAVARDEFVTGLRL